MTVKRKKKVNKIRVAFLLFCVAIPVINWCIFYVYCNFSAFTMAFTNGAGKFSFENFVRLWNEITNADSTLTTAIRNTAITFAILVVSFPLKVLVSYFIYKKVPGHNFQRICFFLPSIIFGVAVSMVFSNMMSPRGFIAEWIARWMNLDASPELLADSRFANYTIWGNMLWLGFPGDLIIWGGTFARIPEETLESARIDGVTWWTEFTRIIVPMVWPTVALKMVLMICGIFSASGNVWLLTGGEYGTHTISSWMYSMLLNNSGGSYRSNVYNYLSAIGLVMTVIALSLSFTVKKWTGKVFDEVEF